MSPYASYLVFFKILPWIGEMLGLLFLAKTGLDRYYAWNERHKKQLGKWGPMKWCLGYFLPLAASGALGAWMFWFQASKDFAIAFYVDRTAGVMMAVMSICILGHTGWLLLHPEKVTRVIRPRVRSRSRTDLGF